VLCLGYVPHFLFSIRYDAAWPAQADARGLFHFDSGVDAICQFTAEKNVALFSGNGVFSPQECAARKDIMLEAYVGTVETECATMISMMNENVIPDAKKAGLDAQVCAVICVC